MTTLAKACILALGVSAIESDNCQALGFSMQQEPGGGTASPSDGAVSRMDKQQFRRRFILPMQQALNGGSCEQRSQALADLMGASAQLSKVGADIEKYFGPTDNELVTAFVPAMRDQCTKEAYQDCVEKHNFGPLRLLGLQRARQDEIINAQSEDATYDELWKKCVSFELEYESLTQVEGVTDIRVRSMIPLTLDKSEPTALVLKGEGALDPKVQYKKLQDKCREEVKGPTPSEPFIAMRLAIFVDTTGQGALRKERERITEAFKALAAEEKENKDSSPGALARRKARRGWLERDLANLERAEAKQQSTNLDKPARIELDFLPGDIDVALVYHCPGAPYPFPQEHDFYKTTWPSVFMDKLNEGIPRFVFEPGDIQGGEQYARKEVKGTRPELSVTMKFTLWHRPPRAGVGSS